MPPPISTVNVHVYVVSTGEVYETMVSPSEPAVFKYTFPEGETNAVVKVESDTDHCMVSAIQNTEVSTRLKLHSHDD